MMNYERKCTFHLYTQTTLWPHDAKITRDMTPVPRDRIDIIYFPPNF